MTSIESFGARDAAKRAVLDSERALNERYLSAMREKAARAGRVEVSVIRSTLWTEGGPRIGAAPHVVSPFVGRVALDVEDPLLGSNFYIAGWHHEDDEARYQAVSWAAPIAALFFEGAAADDDLAGSVTGRRTFVVLDEDLVNYQDEVNGSGDPFEPRESELQVPTAPRRRDRPGVGPAATARPGPASQPPSPATPPPSAPPGPPVHGESSPGRPIRAEEAVAEVMTMPKKGRLSSVLATLQPDQYRLVSWPASQPLVVQGQPGTGKTGIATHRAAFLTSAERGTDRIRHLAIVGPSDRYVEHITPLVGELKDGDARIRVMSLPALLEDIAGVGGLAKPGPTNRIQASHELGRAVEMAVRAWTSAPGRGSRSNRVREACEWLRTDGRASVQDEEIRSWLGGLPDWRRLRTESGYLPMLATVALALDPRAVKERVGHLIVDEAQDVRPIEWRILTQYLTEPGAGLSIFGDIHQRRSDWTAEDWRQLCVDQELTDDDGNAPVEELGLGFRSTQQILRYANRLLPVGQRAQAALRSGPAPTVHKAPPEQVASTARSLAIELCARHEGLVAVISLKPREIAQAFRSRGWVRGAFRDSWTDGESTVVVFHPDEARGLEFDAVVVVEPADFPENVGRQGVLYTSLTRANKELSIVHAQRLPHALR